MIETTIYKCEYCSAEFDDEYEATCHEWVCRYNDTRKQVGGMKCQMLLWRTMLLFRTKRKGM